MGRKGPLNMSNLDLLHAWQIALADDNEKDSTETARAEQTAWDAWSEYSDEHDLDIYTGVKVGRAEKEKEA